MKSQASRSSFLRANAAGKTLLRHSPTPTGRRYTNARLADEFTRKLAYPKLLAAYPQKGRTLRDTGAASAGFSFCPSHRHSIGMKPVLLGPKYGSFRETLESLISVASRAAEIFERSNIEQKRQLVAFVFSNLRLRGKARVFLAFALRPDGQPAGLCKLAGGPGFEPGLAESES